MEVATRSAVKIFDAVKTNVSLENKRYNLIKLPSQFVWIIENYRKCQKSELKHLRVLKNTPIWDVPLPETELPGVTVFVFLMRRAMDIVADSLLIVSEVTFK
jgi:hypothetical protein